MNSRGSLYIDLSGLDDQSDRRRNLMPAGGVVLIIVGLVGWVLWVQDGLQEWEMLLSPFANFLLGTVLILRSYQVPIKGMKRYIAIDSEKLTIKRRKVFQSPTKIYLDDIEDIQFNTSEMLVHAGSQKVVLPYSDLSYQYVQQLKKCLGHFLATSASISKG